jgi:hypothetical protein
VQVDFIRRSGCWRPRQELSSERFGLYGQSPALIVIEAHSRGTELFSKHPLLLAKIFNDLQLAVVRPPGDGDQQKPEWVEHSLAYSKPIISIAAVAKYRIFMQIQFSDHTRSPAAQGTA